MQGDLSVFDQASGFVYRDGEALVPAGIKLDLSGLDLGNLKVGGHFIVECYDKDGNFKWEDVAENAVTTVGIAYLLNVSLCNQAQIAAWYIGIVDNAGFSTFAPADTMASHAGWSEVAVGNYSNTTRVTWSPSAPSGGAIVNAATSNFNMTNAGALSVYGLFLNSDSTKSGTVGTLFSTAAFTGGTQAVNSGDTLKITYTVSATSS